MALLSPEIELTSGKVSTRHFLEQVAMPDVEPLIDAIYDSTVAAFDEWKRGVEVAARGLFEGAGQARVEVVPRSARARVEDSTSTLRVTGDIGSETSIMLTIERARGGRLRAGHRLQLKLVALHLENGGCFQATGRVRGTISSSGSHLCVNDADRLWLDLTHGRASLLRVGDSYRVLAAPPSWARHRAFSSTQMQVVNLAIGGALYKSIANELHLSAPTISHSLRLAAARVGVRKPVELLRIAYQLTSQPANDEQREPHEDETTTTDVRLTAAEREILKLVVAGLSNRTIARARNRSLRTVANQVATLLRKLRCASRYHLAASRRG